jgi:hypothetical protein
MENLTMLNHSSQVGEKKIFDIIADWAVHRSSMTGNRDGTVDGSGANDDAMMSTSSLQLSTDNSCSHIQRPMSTEATDIREECSSSWMVRGEEYLAPLPDHALEDHILSAEESQHASMDQDVEEVRTFSPQINCPVLSSQHQPNQYDTSTGPVALHPSPSSLPGVTHYCRGSGLSVCAVQHTGHINDRHAVIAEITEMSSCHDRLVVSCGEESSSYHQAQWLAVQRGMELHRQAEIVLSMVR